MRRLLTIILILNVLVICSCGDNPQGKEPSLSPEYSSTLQSYVQDQDAGVVTEQMAYVDVPHAIEVLISSMAGRTELSSLADNARSIVFDGSSKAAYIATRASYVFSAEAGVKESVHECLVIHAPSSKDPVVWSFALPFGEGSFAPVDKFFIDSMVFSKNALVITMHWTEDTSRVSRELTVNWDALQVPGGVGKINIETGEIIP